MPSCAQLAAKRAGAHDALLRPLRHQTAAAQGDGQPAPSDGQSAPSNCAKPCDVSAGSKAKAVSSVQPPLTPDLQQRIRQLANQPLPSADGPVGPARQACAPGQAALLASLTAQPPVKSDSAVSAPATTVKSQPGAKTQPDVEAQVPISPTLATAAAASVASQQSAADQKAQRAEAPPPSEVLRQLLARYSARGGDCTARAELAHAAWRYAIT